MKIAVVGLGLIGASFLKTLCAKTEHICFGLDIDEAVLQKAQRDGVIVSAITEQQLWDMDLTILCLHPQACMDFALANRGHFRPGSIVIDVCGVKERIDRALYEPLTRLNVHYIGTHPMAGREFSGYDYATDTLFDNASFIMTPHAGTEAAAVDTVTKLARDMGFGRIVTTTPENHDRMIAFTSQLAHVVSNAYIKSPALADCNGYSAGSYLDMTRVARLNEDMWSELFLMNAHALTEEIDLLVSHLMQYRDAICAGDRELLRSLLREGRILKENSR